MPKTELDGLPVIETDESEEIAVAVKPDDIQEATGPIPSSIRLPLPCVGGTDGVASCTKWRNVKRKF